MIQNLQLTIERRIRNSYNSKFQNTVIEQSNEINESTGYGSTSEFTFIRRGNEITLKYIMFKNLLRQKNGLWYFYVKTG